MRSLANILGREVRLVMSSSECLWIMKRIFVIKCKLKLSPNLLRSLANILGREVRLVMSSSECLWIMKRIFVIKCKLKLLLIIPFHVFVLLWSDECELEIKDWTNNMIYWIQHDIISTRHINTFLQRMYRKHY